MSKTNDVVYLPALKAKGGEFGALANLSTAAKKRILPLIDVLPVPPDWNTHEPSKTLEAHLDGIYSKIVKCWGTGRELLVDLFDLPLSERTSTGTHPISHLFSEFNQRGVAAIPVTGMERDGAYNGAVKQAVGWAHGAVGIRLLAEDIALPSKTSSPLLKLVSSVGAIPDRSVLLLDFRELPQDQVVDASTKALASLKAAFRLAKWRHMVVLASGMPNSLSEVKANAQAQIPRTELELWRNVIRGAPSAIPLFGDYGVVNPEFMEPMDPRKMRPSAKIRYTLEDRWLIIKGTSFRKDPAQFRALAAVVERQPGFCGQGFSWGDSYIFNCRKKGGGAGNLETWVRADTSHHIEFVSKQIANLLSA